MILYLGTSCLIKLYVEDADSETIRQWVSEAEIVATCRVAYTEAVSALDIRSKKGDLTEKDYDCVYEAFSSDWGKFAVVDFDDLEAGRLVKKYGINRMAAIHLSAAMNIQRAGNALNLAFSSVDERLCNAAGSEGLRILSLS
jgi:predicted nucleic acid-binding protein